MGGLGSENIAENFLIPFHPFVGLLCSPAPVCVKGQQKAQAGAGDRHMAACMVPWHLPHVLCKQGCACLAQTELSHPSHPPGIWFCSLSAAQGSSFLRLCWEQQLLFEFLQRAATAEVQCRKTGGGGAKKGTQTRLLVFIFC